MTAQDRYREAGVDTAVVDTGLGRIIAAIKGTWPAAGQPGAVALDIGYFANVVDIYEGERGLALCTDGVGSTKSIIADMMKKYDTIGIDCVAMNVNDLICVGARPVSMVDYIAVEAADADMLGRPPSAWRKGRGRPGSRSPAAKSRWLGTRGYAALTWLGWRLAWCRSTMSSPGMT